MAARSLPNTPDPSVLLQRDVSDVVSAQIVATARQADLGATLLNWHACHRLNANISSETCRAACARYGIRYNCQAKYLLKACLQSGLVPKLEHLYPSHHPWERPRAPLDSKSAGVAKHGIPLKLGDMPLLAAVDPDSFSLREVPWRTVFQLLSYISHWFDVVHVPRFEGHLRLQWADAARLSQRPGMWWRLLEEVSTEKKPLCSRVFESTNKFETIELASDRWPFPASLVRQVFCAAQRSDPTVPLQLQMGALRTNQIVVASLTDASGGTDHADRELADRMFAMRDGMVSFGLNGNGFVRTHWPAGGMLADEETESEPRRLANELAARCAARQFRRLLELDCNLLLGDPHNCQRTPLMSVCMSRSYCDAYISIGLDCVAWLRRRGCNSHLNEKDGIGSTCMHHLVSIPAEDVLGDSWIRRKCFLCRYFLLHLILEEGGANPLTLDEDNLTVLQRFQSAKWRHTPRVCNDGEEESKQLDESVQQLESLILRFEGGFRSASSG